MQPRKLHRFLKVRPSKAINTLAKLTTNEILLSYEQSQRNRYSDFPRTAFIDFIYEWPGRTGYLLFA